MSTPAERSVNVGDHEVRLLEQGTGDPVVMLHHSIGPPGWTDVHERLSASRRVITPDIPGYGASTRPEWAREPRDLAVLLLQALDEMGLEKTTLAGCGLGGFIAAEMATMSGSRLARVVLIGAAGLKPREGDIADQMLMSFGNYVRNGFADEASFKEIYGEEISVEVRQLWDYSREMTARVTWKPYMFSNRLPHLLRGVRTPALILWGRQDRTVPPVCAEQYAEALPNARLEWIEGAGHFPELEQPDTVAKLIEEA